MTKDANDGPGGCIDGCGAVREAITALINGAESSSRPGEIDEHLDSCQGCRQWEAEALALHLRGRHRTPGRGLVKPSEAYEPPVRLRYALGIVASTEIAPVIIWLVNALGGSALDPARGLVAAEIAFAIACLIAALQPRRARGVLPVGVALTVLIVGSSITDVVRGMATPLGESHHIVELAGTAMLALLAWQVARASIGTTEPR